MKNIKVLLFAAILGSFYACEDAIDIIQPGERNDADEVYTTIVELERGLDGVYNAISTESTIEFTSIFTDEVSIGINNGGQGLNDGSYSHQLFGGSDAPLSIWQTNYTTINLTNRLLLAAERITIDEDDAALSVECQTTRRDYVVAQLHAIRAFCHFQLMTYFSTDLKNDAALGVIILDVVPPTDNYDLFLPRSTNGEVFTYINNELQESLDLFDAIATAEGDGVCGVTPIVDFDNTRISPVVITALKARMAAYRGDYTNAMTFATEAFNEIGFASRAAFPDVWADRSEAGVIFKLARVPGDFTIASYWASQNSSATGSPFFEVSRGLYDSYAAGDIRKIDIVDASSTIATTLNLANPKTQDVLILDKYPGSEGVNLLNDIKVIRGEEMLLIMAEAYAAAGAYDGASNSVASTLLTLRNERYSTSAPASLPNYGGSAQAAWADILLERRRELAFEGHRYIDIKRLSALAGTPGIERVAFDCALYNACTLSASDHRFTLPIPTNEIIANPSIAGQQNPGY